MAIAVTVEIAAASVAAIAAGSVVEIAVASAAVIAAASAVEIVKAAAEEDSAAVTARAAPRHSARVPRATEHPPKALRGRLGKGATEEHRAGRAHLAHRATALVDPAPLSSPAVQC